MKKLFLLFISILLTLIAVTTSASTITFFKTIGQVEKYCPPINAMLFTPLNPNIVHSKGKITAYINSAQFHSDFVIQPQNMDANGIVQNVTFRQVEGSYGYISGNQITCLYSYPGYVGNNVNLILQGIVPK